MAARAPGKWSVTGAIALWLCAVAAGWCWIDTHDFQTIAPAKKGIADRWPGDSALVRHDGRATMVVFLHPKCPCSRASLHELEQLLDSLDGATKTPPELIVDATVPVSADNGWYETDTLAFAQKLEGADVFVDRGGAEAARFGATTSGTVMMFDAAGKRCYAGGVTGSRGHEGANASRDCLEQLLRGNDHVAHEMPTFGCRLCLPDDAEASTMEKTAAN
jgi:hypothetical protein